MVRPERARDFASFIPDVDRDGQPGPGEPRNLQTLKPHASLAEDHHAVTDLESRCLHRGHAIAERLQAGRLAVGNPRVHFDQSDFGQRGQLGEAAGHVETNDGAQPAKIAAFALAQCTASARQLGPGRHAIARSKRALGPPRFDDAGAKLVAEELDRRLALEAALDPVIRQRGDALRSCASVTLGWTQSGATSTSFSSTTGSAISSSRMSPNP